MGLTTPEEGLSGAQSCWFEPGVTGYYLLNFQTDPAGAAPPAAYGWNMDVWIDFGLGRLLGGLVLRCLFVCHAWVVPPSAVLPPSPDALEARA